jgi:hypothetical protein
MCNNNMSVMREYSLAVFLMATFDDGCKVCYGDRAIYPEKFCILYEMLFTGIQLETVRLRRSVSLHLANLTQIKCLFKYQEPGRIN